MGNVNSMSNKTDKLTNLVKNDRTYLECRLLGFTETWLSSNVPEASWFPSG